MAVDTNQVPDASTITPPTWLPGFASPVDLNIEVAIELGTLVKGSDWPQQIRSSLHAITMESSVVNESNASQSCLIRALPGEQVNRDFILRGRLDGSYVATSLVVEPPRIADMTTSDCGNDATDNDKQSLGTLAIQIIPPSCDAKVPRDIVFLLDRSGSMCGWKIDAARRGISRLVDSLSANDRFQVLAFDDHVDSAFKKWNQAKTAWTSATDANRYAAIRWLAKIDSRGGTEMGGQT